MEGKNLSCEISRDNIVYTLMKVSQLDSTSSSSLDQSTSTINKAIDCEKSCSKITNTNTQSHIHPNECPIIPTMNIESNLLRAINEKLLQLYQTNYIHWKTLLTFGFALWVALCIADKSSQQHYSSLKIPKTSNSVKIEIDTDDEEEIIQQTIADSPLKWFHNIPSYISWANKLPITKEASILSLFMVIIIFIEFRLRSRNKTDKAQESCNQCHHDFQRAKLYDDEYYRDKLTMERLKHEKESNIYDELDPVSASNNHSHVKIIPYDGMSVNSDLFWELKIIDSCDHHQVNDNIKRNDNEHINKLGIDSNVATNIDRSSWNKNNNVINNNNNMKLNSQNFSTYNCNCSLPYCNYNPIASINVNSTYDTEIHKYIMSKCNTSTTAFEEITGDLWKYKSNNIGRRKAENNDSNGDNNELSSLSTIKNNKNNNNRIISSSPAFKKFLSGLKNNPTAFNTQSWIYN